MLFGNFQIINIQIIYFIHRCLKLLRQQVNRLVLTPVLATMVTREIMIGQTTDWIGLKRASENISECGRQQEIY